MMPSWPCVVNGSSATSVITPSPGTAFLSARTARWARPFGFQASLPSSDFASGGVTGNSAIAGTPSLATIFASLTSSSMVMRSTPGIDGTFTRCFLPSITKTG